MYETPSRTPSQASQRRPPTLMAPLVNSSGPPSPTYQNNGYNPPPTALSTPALRGTHSFRGFNPHWSPQLTNSSLFLSNGSPVTANPVYHSQFSPQTSGTNLNAVTSSPAHLPPPNSRQPLRRPVSMQTLSTARSNARLSATPHKFSAPVEPYRGRIHVGVRVKPLCGESLPPSWQINAVENAVEHETAGSFRLDRVYDMPATNKQVYDNSVDLLVHKVVEGYNATVFAYGTTGSGKTYTMQGTVLDQGVIPRSVEQLFALLQKTPSEFRVHLSYLEIYNERVYDLLNSNSQPVEVKLRDTSVSAQTASTETRIVGQQMLEVRSAKELLQLVARGDGSRRTHSTQYNEHSSRSHAVVRIEVHRAVSASANQTASANQSADFTDEPTKIAGVQQSVLYLCDLAGSERAVDDLERRKEGAFINKSLLTLGTVIATLSQGGSGHVPYRESKLTRLLQPSLSGSALVAVLCTVQLGSASSVETINSLRFAARAKNIVVTVKRSSVYDDPAAMLLSAQRQIEQCQSELESQRRETIRLRAERDDLQDKLALLETAEPASAEQSLERMTGISFGSENAHHFRQLETENAELRRQREHLYQELAEMQENVAKLEREQALPALSDGGSTGSESNEILLREHIQELQEAVRDRDAVIAVLKTVQEHRDRFEGACTTAVEALHASVSPSASSRGDKDAPLTNSGLRRLSLQMKDASPTRINPTKNQHTSPFSRSALPVTVVNSPEATRADADTSRESIALGNLHLSSTD